VTWHNCWIDAPKSAKVVEAMPRPIYGYPDEKPILAVGTWSGMNSIETQESGTQPDQEYFDYGFRSPKSTAPKVYACAGRSRRYACYRFTMQQNIHLPGRVL
jgi:hypothetical protein